MIVWCYHGEIYSFIFAALVCGVVGIVGSFIPYVYYVSGLIAIAGIVLGAVSLKKIKESGTDDNKGLAIAGLVCGIVGVAIDIISVACAICAICAIGNAIGGMANALKDIKF